MSSGSLPSTFRPNPNAPIPNNPFFYPETNTLNGDFGRLIVGSGLTVNYASGTINASGGGGGGAVSQVTGGAGISVSPTIGSVVVTNTGVLQLTAGLGITITGSNANYTISSPYFGTVTSITAGSGLTGGIITSSGTLTVDGNVVLLKSLYTSKGQILVSTAAGSVSPLASLGTPNGYVLTVDSSSVTNLKWAAMPTSIQTVSGIHPIQVTSGTSPVVSIAPATTSQSGATMLVNNLVTNDRTKALTAAQGYSLQQQISSLNSASGLTLAGTLDATTGDLLTVTSSGSGAGFNVGSPLPAPALANKDYFVIVTTAGLYTPPGGSAVNAGQGDWFNSTGTAWDYLNVGFDAPAATTSVAGIVCLATNGDAIAGTDSTKALTPAAGAAAYVPLACLTAKGTLITATATTTPSALAIGTDGQILTACSACAGGMFWGSAGAPGIPCAAITGKGAVLTGTAAGQPTSLAIGLDGQYLTANSGAPTGLCWVSPAFVACSAYSSKGSLLAGQSANTPVALSVGADGQILSANSGASSGLSWCTPSYIPCSIITGKGGIVGGFTTGTPAYHPPAPSNGCVLVSNASCASGLDWVSPPALAAPLQAGVVFGCQTSDSAYYGCYSGLCAIAGGSRYNTGVGYCAIASNSAQTTCHDTALGYCALAVAGGLTYNSGSYNTAVGSETLTHICSGIQGNTAIGAGIHSVAGSELSGSNNLILSSGRGINVPDPAGCCQLAIGFSVVGAPQVSCYWLTGCSDKTIRPGAGIRDCNNSTGIAGQNLLFSAGAGGVRWGTLPLASYGLAGGILGCVNSDGVAIGGNSAVTAATAGNPSFENTTVIGSGAPAFLSTNLNATTIIGGSSAGNSGAITCSTYVGACVNTSNGTSSSAENVYIGACSALTSTGSCNTFVGFQSGAALNFNGTNNVAIGHGSNPSASGVSNTVTLGNGSITTLRAAVTSITSLSDARDKTNIQELSLGIEFVKDLNPVTFQWQQREPNPVKDGKAEAGFVAQQLQEAQFKHGADYLGLVNSDNPNQLEASPGKLIPVLVRALQDLTAAHERLRADFDAYRSTRP